MSEPRQTVRPGYFDALCTADPDPWKFAASVYERAKHTLTLNAMPKPRYRLALEVGCDPVDTARLAILDSRPVERFALRESAIVPSTRRG
jgi:hypothetical protein